MIASNYIEMFKRRIDPKSIPVGNFQEVSVIMRNYDLGRTYYVHYIEEFWHTFGRYYPHIGGIGMSVAKKELEQAVALADSWIVIIMPYNSGLKFYGLEARTWFGFCNNNGTWHNHTAKDGLENGAIPAKLLKNMEDIKKDGLENWM